MGTNEHSGELLRKHGLKHTRQRAAVLDILDAKQMPLSAEDVYIELSNLGIAVNLSTVYRTLDAMLDKGLIREVGLAGDNRATYELARMEHRHYLVCIGCKKVMPLDGCPIKEYIKGVASETHYAIAGHRLDIFGYCPSARRWATREGECVNTQSERANRKQLSPQKTYWLIGAYILFVTAAAGYTLWFKGILDFTAVRTFSMVFVSILIQAFPFMLIGVLVSSTMHFFVPDNSSSRSFPPNTGWAF
jgi:Fur family ferric uptake transcriptional regulator